MKRPVATAAFIGLIVAAFWIGLRIGGKNAESRPAGQAPPSGPTAGEAGAEPEDLSPRAVRLTREQRRLAGVRVGLAENKPFVHTLRVLGRVDADETKVYRLRSAVDGWIIGSSANSVGTQVAKGAVLATFYSPQFLDAQQSLIYALDAVDRLQQGRRLELGRSDLPAQTALDQLTVQRQIDLLRNLGMDDSQIEEIGKTRLISQNIRLVAPAPGFIVLRDASPGQRILRGDELFRIADLDRVWVLADVFENEAAFFRPGVEAVVRLPGLDKPLRAVTSRVLPVFDTATRTLKVRLETDNPGFALRPGMFADVELPLRLEAAVTVPAEAILQAGRRTVVFVERAEGIFEPRAVSTGWRMGGRVEIVFGIEAGERIALDGTFLLDSESRLQAVAEGLFDDDVPEPEKPGPGRLP